MSAQDNGQKQDGDRVRTKEPTVVTVYGQRENVEEDKAPQPERSVAGKVGHGIKSGAAAIGKGIVGFAGWLANVDETVPREKDREKQQKAAQP